MVCDWFLLLLFILMYKSFRSHFHPLIMINTTLIILTFFFHSFDLESHESIYISMLSCLISFFILQVIRKHLIMKDELCSSSSTKVEGRLHHNHFKRHKRAASLWGGVGLYALTNYYTWKWLFLGSNPYCIIVWSDVDAFKRSLILARTAKKLETSPLQNHVALIGKIERETNGSKSHPLYERPKGSRVTCAVGGPELWSR